MEFHYELAGAGWADARIVDGAAQADLTASYLSDALGDLLVAVGSLLEGAAEARCSWEDEPGEYRWIFVRTGAGDIRLTILQFDDIMTSQPDERGELLFATTQPLDVLTCAIADGATAVLNEHGEKGYLAKWLDAPFPTAALECIRAQLGGASPT